MTDEGYVRVLVEVLREVMWRARSKMETSGVSTTLEEEVARELLMRYPGMKGIL